MNKWSKQFFLDLGERVGATFVAALLGLVTLSATTRVDWTDWNYLWPVVGVPTLVSLLKGFLANVADPESGASLLPAPPGPVVNEGGYTDILYVVGAGLCLLAFILLVTTLLKVFVVGIPLLVVVFIVGVVLVLVSRRRGL